MLSYMSTVHTLAVRFFEGYPLHNAIIPDHDE